MYNLFNIFPVVLSDNDYFSVDASPFLVSIFHSRKNFPWMRSCYCYTYTIANKYLSAFVLELSLHKNA
jgi:hypothetical protein